MEMERKYQEYKDINEQVLYLYNSKKIIVDVEDEYSTVAEPPNP